MRRRRTPAPVVEVRIESVLVDGPLSRRGLDELEQGLRTGLEARLLGMLDPSAPGETAPTAYTGDGPEQTGRRVGSVLAADLGPRLVGRAVR